MNDADLWELERNGHPVSHCRAKIVADRQKIIDRRNREAARAILSPRWAA